MLPLLIHKSGFKIQPLHTNKVKTLKPHCKAKSQDNMRLCETLISVERTEMRPSCKVLSLQTLDRKDLEPWASVFRDRPNF